MRNSWTGRNLLGVCCLLALASCAVTPPAPTPSLPAEATVPEAESAAPGVSSIAFRSSPATGDTYGLGETIEVAVEFDRAVAATGSPQVALSIGTRPRYATLSSWSRQSLYFSYTVQEQDRDEDGISIAANALALNGGTVKAADGTTDVDLTHGPLEAGGDGHVDGSLTTTPGVTDISFISSPARGYTYGLGETVEVRVDFPTAVRATGKPQVALAIGTQTRHATFSGWSRRSLFFSYSVHEEDRDEDGISIPANALLLNGGTITAADGRIDVDLTHEAVAAQRGTKVNGSLTTQPRVTDIFLGSSPARGDTYELGETIEVRVQFDRAVTATGKPQVALTIGSETRHAALFGWGRQHLTFTYTVQEEDRDEDGISIAANALHLDGGTIMAAVGATEVDLTHGPVVADRGSRVNGRDSAPPRVREIVFNSFPAKGGTYELGETIEVRIEFDRAVTIAGKPQVALTIGTRTRHATLSAWSTQSLHFEYTVQGVDRDEDGISIAANALLLDGGTIKSDDGSADADLDHSATGPDPTRKVSGSRSTP